MQIFNFQFSIFNYFYYFCTVKRIFSSIGFVLRVLLVCAVTNLEAAGPQAREMTDFTLDEIILDIYSAVSELGETDFEQLQTDLYAIHNTPIDLNHTSDEELSRLYFLSPRQIDDILMYADKHPFQSLYELLLIPSLADYEIRDLLPFVQITNDQSPITNDQSPITNNPLYPKEVFAHANHEIITRVDARNIEGFEGTDPVFVQTRYRFDYKRRIGFGAQLRRPAGGDARSLQYGAWLELRDIGHLHSLVAGNFQASFGQGLVLAPVFHSGKSAYTQSVGHPRNGLRHYSSVDGEGLHGAGTTLRWEWNKHTRLDVSALYSMRRANDSVWHHLVGANMTVRYKRLEVQVSAIENIWSDSIHPYRDAAYNRHYFRGRRQFVGGVSARYNFGAVDLFGEVATTQNHEIINQPSQIINTKTHWGVGAIAGSRFYPASGVSLTALYRYYSPYFDNALGYAFSETSRIGDEHGGYLGFEITRLRRWRFSGYGDVFRFAGPKYGIPDSPSIGYDAMAEMRYTNHQSPITNHKWFLSFRARARKKGDLSTYSARFQFNWQRDGWSLRTTAESNLTDDTALNYGVSVAQDLAYDFQSPMTNYQLPISLRLRLQWFDARNWNNRIYLYEHDVLYAFSIPATYGRGGRAYICLQWQIIKQLTLYLRLSETVYNPHWAAEQKRSLTRTDVHFLLRAKI